MNDQVKRTVTMTPARLAQGGTEDAIQKALIQHCRMTLQDTFPEIRLMYHVPNGGQRGDRMAAATTMAVLKSMGLVAGVPDLCLPISRCGYANLYIELKSPNGRGELSKDQYNYITLLCNNGNLVAVLDDWQHASQLIEIYLRGEHDTIRMVTDKELFDVPEASLVDTCGYFKKYYLKNIAK